MFAFPATGIHQYILTISDVKAIGFDINFQALSKIFVRNKCAIHRRHCCIKYHLMI